MFLYPNSTCYRNWPFYMLRCRKWLFGVNEYTNWFTLGLTITFFCYWLYTGVATVIGDQNDSKPKFVYEFEQGTYKEPYKKHLK